MRILLDTHMMIWIFAEPKKIPHSLLDELDRSEIYFSYVSILEIALKRSVKKLPIPKTSLDFYNTAISSGWKFLDFNPKTVRAFEKIPVLHKDPFDRLLIAQAIEYNMVLASVDRHFKHYNVKLLDA